MAFKDLFASVVPAAADTGCIKQLSQLLSLVGIWSLFISIHIRLQMAFKDLFASVVPAAAVPVDTAATAV
jgi:hypothetical protein